MNEPHNWTRMAHDLLTWADSHELLAYLIFVAIFTAIVKGAVTGGSCFCKNCENR